MGRGEALHVRRAWGHRLFPALPFTAAEGPATASIVPRRSPNFPERPGQLSTCTRVNLRVPFVRSPSCGRQEAGLFQEAGSPRPPPSRSEFGSWLGAGWAEAKPVHPGGSPRADRQHQDTADCWRRDPLDKTLLLRLEQEVRGKGSPGSSFHHTRVLLPAGLFTSPGSPPPPCPCRISSYCKSKGWQRIQDSRREDYKLKWCEVKCRDNYYSFREGEQLLYQIPNNKLLTTKIGLLSALREYSRVVNKIHKTSLCAQAKVLKMEEFFPETYRLDIRDDREAFFTLFDENQIWICKPTASNQGKGIFLLRNQEEVAALQVKAQSIEDDPIYRKMPFRAPQARVAQRYIQNPLLLDGKKFDVRSYLLIACAMPYMVFFGHGYARLTLSLYDPHSSDLSGHLTNQFMQKKSPLYVLLKEDTVWSMDRLNRHINDKFRKTKGLPRDWVFTTFTKRMQQIMVHCFQAVKAKLHCKLGYFDLIGCDFLIDENFKVWLLEMNSNPALHTNCEVLKEVIPGVIVETLGEALVQPLQTSSRQFAQPWMCHPTLSPNSDAHKLSSPMPSGPTEERHPCRTSPLPWCLPHLISTGSLTSSACRTSTQPRTVTPLPRPLQQCPHSPPPPDLALETFQKSLRNQKMLPLLSQRRFVLLHNGETDLWPRLGGSRSALRPPPPPPPRAACEADCSAPPPTRAADRRGARRPALPRSPGGTHGPPHSEQRPRAPGLGPDGAQSGDPAPEPCARLAEEEREERRSAGHRGS
ncbi:inactive polyglycylase TTLL10 isoform X15 [Vulpes lagopus]|uniref:inactive polyglycylase TTLL10 isoform X15 n=1 Tax=Vulpes lagopus TaxID=494514 RepID=UPI001BC8E8F6|nr:inactive polyglycylase TTLL10 isoform X15 [Vulpes lagopus]